MPIEVDGRDVADARRRVEQERDGEGGLGRTASASRMRGPASTSRMTLGPSASRRGKAWGSRNDTSSDRFFGVMP